jgi:hypothetical protein
MIFGQRLSLCPRLKAVAVHHHHGNVVGPWGVVCTGGKGGWALSLCLNITCARRRGPREELSFLFNSLPTLKSAQPEIGSSSWKSIARLVVSGAPSVALENLEDRVPSMPSRTHNRIRSPR